MSRILLVSGRLCYSFPVLQRPCSVPPLTTFIVGIINPLASLGVLTKKTRPRCILHSSTKEELDKATV